MSDLAAQTRAALDAAVAAIGGAPRKGQIEMAEAVSSALTDRHQVHRHDLLILRESLPRR